MRIIQSRSFEKKLKKFSKKQKLIIDENIKLINNNPTIGTEKKGDLHEVFVNKFKINKTQYLLSYRFSKSILELIIIGPHQNYYRDLKKYFKNK